MHVEQLAAAIDLLKNARHVVALTGAGISTHSGIPDFRSPDSGLWQQANSADVASLQGFKHHPERFYAWISSLAQTILDAQPNPAHIALARLEAAGKLNCVITQNIDMLHTRAGSQVVHELHGHFREMTCIYCFTVYPAEDYIRRFIESNQVPTCPHCGHTLKPNVILFGEQLPARALLAARREAQRCDAMLVAGSSLEVFPAADLPVIARRAGAVLIFINLMDTALDPIAGAVIHADVVDVLPLLADALESEQSR